MISPSTLRRFADENNLEIRDNVDVDNWAKAVNNNDGYCPVGKICPCNKCNAGLYKRKQYVIPELGRAVDALEAVRVGLEGVVEEDESKAKDVIRRSIAVVKDDAGKHECPRCSEYMEGLQRKLQWLEKECEIGGFSCREEIDMTIGRVARMQETFMASDDTIRDEMGEDEEEKTDERENAALEQEKDKKPSDFHECMKRVMVELYEDDTVPKNKKMCIASKVCGGEHMTIEEAKKICLQ